MKQNGNSARSQAFSKHFGACLRSLLSAHNQRHSVVRLSITFCKVARTESLLQCRKICCKVAVIYLELYALNCFMFCSNDCFSADYAVYSLEAVVCSGEFRIHNPKVGGSIPPPATNKINSLGGRHLPLFCYVGTFVTVGVLPLRKRLYSASQTLVGGVM